MVAIDTIDDLEPRYADRLREAGITSCEGLLEAGADREGRRELSSITGVGEKRVLSWVNRADLMRVRGVSVRYSGLLAAAGVDTVPELARRNAANLAESMAELNRRKRNKLVERVPTENLVSTWVERAGALPRAVEY